MTGDVPSEKQSDRRPYFLPASIDLETLPADVKAALRAIVLPTYDELVMGAKSSLERSTGVTVAFLLAMEVLDHIHMGHALELTSEADEAKADALEKRMARHLRLVKEKQKATNILLRIRAIRAKRGPHYMGAPDV